MKNSRTSLRFPDGWDVFQKVENEARYLINLPVFDAITSGDLLTFDRSKSIISQMQQIHNKMLNRIYEEGDFDKIKGYFEQEQLPNELHWSTPTLGLPSKQEEPSFKIIALGVQQNKEKEMIIAKTQEHARKLRDFVDCSNMRLVNSQNYGKLFNKNGIHMIPIMGIYYSHYNLPIIDIDKFRLAIKEVLSAQAKKKSILESFSNICFSFETEVNYMIYLEHYKQIPINRKAFEIQIQAANAALDHLQKLKEVSYELRSNKQDLEDKFRFLKSSVSQIDLNIH